MLAGLQIQCAGKVFGKGIVALFICTESNVFCITFSTVYIAHSCTLQHFRHYYTSLYVCESIINKFKNAFKKQTAFFMTYSLRLFLNSQFRFYICQTG